MWKIFVKETSFFVKPFVHKHIQNNIRNESNKNTGKVKTIKFKYNDFKKYQNQLEIR